jgi:hypothetical protein
MHNEAQAKQPAPIEVPEQSLTPKEIRHLVEVSELQTNTGHLEQRPESKLSKEAKDVLVNLRGDRDLPEERGLELDAPTAPKAPELAATQSNRSPRYSSQLKRHIRNHFTDHPDATDIEVCGHLDEEGFDQAVVPESWLKGGNRSLADAYQRHPEARGKIQTMISKVRRDLGLTKAN